MARPKDPDTGRADPVWDAGADPQTCQDLIQRIDMAVRGLYES